jgi:hypothetical protein
VATPSLFFFCGTFASQRIAAEPSRFFDHTAKQTGDRLVNVFKSRPAIVPLTLLRPLLVSPLVFHGNFRHHEINHGTTSAASNAPGFPFQTSRTTHQSYGKTI